MVSKEKVYSLYELREMGHCKISEQCVTDIYCHCPCKQCQAQDCFRPECSCSRVHGYNRIKVVK
jgi:hypothetical protein